MHPTLRRFKEKLVDLRVDERRFAAAAVVCAPFVEISLRTAGLARTLRWVERVSAQPMEPAAPLIAPARAAAIIDTIYRAQPLRGQCLPRALLQYGLQRLRGAPVRFVVGVKKPNAGVVDAHAWVELAGHEEPALDGFATLLTRPVADPLVPQPARVP